MAEPRSSGSADFVTDGGDGDWLKSRVFGITDVLRAVMVIPEIARWGQTPEDIHQLALRHPHVRTRQRYLAFSKILDGLAPWRAAVAMGINESTIYSWLRRYNKAGPEALEYRHTGGRKPTFSPSGE